jgi:hypothetical protein
VETGLRWFRHVARRYVDSVIRRVEQMKGSQITKDRGRPRKTIREIIRKDLEIIIELDRVWFMIEHYGIF